MPQYTTMYTLGGGQTRPPGPLDRLKAGMLLAVMLFIGALVLAGILAVSLVLLPFVLIGAGIGWFIIRRRIRQALRAMEDPRQDATGRENVRVRRPSGDSPFGSA